MIQWLLVMIRNNDDLRTEASSEKWIHKEERNKRVFSVEHNKDQSDNLLDQRNSSINSRFLQFETNLLS